MRFDPALDAFDRFQQRHALVGFPLAVRRKYSQDQGSYLAATVAYYGFFSVFPLLLVLVTGLGYLLGGRPHLERRLIDSALGQFPVIGGEIHQHALKGSGVALAVGLVASVWTGMGVLLAAENAMNRIWGVPSSARPSFVASRLRALGLLMLLGGGLLVTTALSGVGTTGEGFALAIRAGWIVLSISADFLLFWLAFRCLTVADVGWKGLWSGAAGAAVGYEALQLLGSYYVTHTLRHASSVYGTFGLVIGLLAWIYLSASVVLLAAEANVVAQQRCWPRSLRATAKPPARAASPRRTTTSNSGASSHPSRLARVSWGIGRGWLAAHKLGVGALAGGVVFVALLGDGVRAGFAVLGGWDTASAIFLGWVWLRLGRMDKEQTSRHAQIEEASRSTADVTLLGASVASLFAVGYTLVAAGTRHGTEKGLLIGLTIVSVALSWATVHTIFTLRYGRLYYMSPIGGIDFHDEDRPDYRDLAYVALTIGMTFQVSDTDLQSKPIPRTAIRHALLSYVFGVVIIAITINLVASLLSPG